VANFVENLWMFAFKDVHKGRCPQEEPRNAPFHAENVEIIAAFGALTDQKEQVEEQSYPQKIGEHDLR
jgi:hypothetical protein